MPLRGTDRSSPAEASFLTGKSACAGTGRYFTSIHAPQATRAFDPREADRPNHRSGLG
jgi:hypothetical protein